MVSEEPGATASRRTLLRVAGATAAAAAAAGITACGSNGSSHTRGASNLPPASQVDIQLLNRMLAVEYRAAAFYTATVPLLSGRAHAAAKLFLEQELAHATELSGLIQRSGGKPRDPRGSYDFGQPRGMREIFALLVPLEQAQISGYLDVISQLSTDSKRAAIAAMLANDAQHLSVVQLLLGHDPVPTGFVTGLT